MWKVNPQFLNEKPLHVALVGVGGTGSELASHLIRLHQSLVALGYGGLKVYAFDPDTVSPANIVRQRYTASDLGRNKAETLIHRINLGCGLNWEAFPMRFNSRYANESWDIVISCVDSRKARADLHKWAFGKSMKKHWNFWLDTGNAAVTGQAIIGTPRRPGQQLVHHLPCATELHPELRDTSVPDDTTPSCSAIEALQRQDLFVNSTVANLAAQLLWQLFKNGGLTYHGVYFDIERYQLSPRAVPENPSRKRGRAAEEHAA